MNISADVTIAIATGVVSYVFLFAVLTALTGATFGVGVARIQFGYWPSVRLFHVGETEVRLSPFLLGSHVKFKPGESDTPYAPWSLRAFIAIAPQLIVIALCIIPLGVRALDEAWMAWPQMWAVVASSAPVDMNAALQPLIETSGLTAAAAVVAIKVVMFNLLPVPIFGGGMFLISILEGLTRREIFNRLPQVVLLFSISLPLAFAVLLLWRIVTGT